MTMQRAVTVGRSPRTTSWPTWAGVEWQARARCAGTSPSLWHEGRTRVAGREQVAKAICAACPVQAECLAWALELHDGYAILGGTTPEERRELRKRQLSKASRQRVALARTARVL